MEGVLLLTAQYSAPVLRQQVAFCCVALMLPISLMHIGRHLSHFSRPSEQRALVRIIGMVPLFGLFSLLSLNFDGCSLYVQAGREAYEAYAIYSFLKYLVSFLGEDAQLSRRLSTKPAPFGHHKPPFCCVRPWAMGGDFLRNCKLGVLQYVMVRLTTSTLTSALESLGLYAEGLYHPKSPYFWFTFANCVSQTWALYTLVLFYHATYKDLREIRPFTKFLCIKGVVFFSWWQGLAIGVMVHKGLIRSTEFKRAERIAKGIQDLLICIEMLVAAVAFSLCFPARDYDPSLGPHRAHLPRHPSFSKSIDGAVAKDGIASPRAAHHRHHTSGQESKAGLLRGPEGGAAGGRIPPWHEAFLLVVCPTDLRDDVGSLLLSQMRDRTGRPLAPSLSKMVTKLTVGEDA